MMEKGDKGDQKERGDREKGNNKRYVVMK